VKRQTSRKMKQRMIRVILLMWCVLTLCFFSTVGTNPTYANTYKYIKSSFSGEYNLTVIVNSLNLQWDENLEMNITISNITSGKLIPNSQFFLNISSLVEFYFIYSITWYFYLDQGIYDAPKGFLYRSIYIEHIPTLNPYFFTVHLLNNSQKLMKVAFEIQINSIRTPFIPFFKFEHFIILYFGLLVICSAYILLKHKKIKNSTNNPVNRNSIRFNIGTGV